MKECSRVKYLINKNILASSEGINHIQYIFAGLKLVLENREKKYQSKNKQISTENKVQILDLSLLCWPGT